MLKLSELTGRAVVDMDVADKVGEVDEVILDPEGCRVAGFIVSHGPSLLGGGNKLAFSAATVNSVGPDAVTVKGAVLEHAEGAFPGLPRRRDVVGRKIVGHSGKLYGHIHDVVVDPLSGAILGYAIEESPVKALEGLFGNGRPRTVEYVRADADLRVGAQLVVVPDAAVVLHDPALGNPGADVAPGLPVAGNWADAEPRAAHPSVWLDQRVQPPVEAATPEPVTPGAVVDPATPAPAYEELAFGAGPASPEPPLYEQEAGRPYPGGR